MEKTLEISFNFRWRTWTDNIEVLIEGTLPVLTEISEKTTVNLVVRVVRIQIIAEENTISEKKLAFTLGIISGINFIETQKETVFLIVSEKRISDVDSIFV